MYRHVLLLIETRPDVAEVKQSTLSFEYAGHPGESFRYETGISWLEILLVVGPETRPREGASPHKWNKYTQRSRQMLFWKSEYYLPKQ
jgi:hypothetical protein